MGDLIGVGWVPILHTHGAPLQGESNCLNIRWLVVLCNSHEHKHWIDDIHLITGYAHSQEGK